VSGTTKGSWTRPDLVEWQKHFPRIPGDIFVTPEADVLFWHHGEGYSYRAIAGMRGVSHPRVIQVDQAAQSVLREYIVKQYGASATALPPAATVPAVKSRTDSVYRTASVQAALRTVARRYIRDFEMTDRVMREPFGGAVAHRVTTKWGQPGTKATVLRAGPSPTASLFDLFDAGRWDVAEDPDEDRRLACLVEGCGKQVNGVRDRNDVLYRKVKRTEEVLDAESWQAIVVLDDEAPAEILVLTGLLGDWRKQRDTMNRRRRAPKWRCQTERWMYEREGEWWLNGGTSSKAWRASHWSADLGYLPPAGNR
jgi:hypothetical protein